MRVAWLLSGGAIVQIGLFLVFHGSARELVAVHIGVAVALLVAEEIVTGGMLLHAFSSRVRR